MKKLQEYLSDYAHVAWSEWMKYMFEKSKQNDDGTVTIPKELVDRWTRQSGTKYSELPENEKASDRKEADIIIDIFKVINNETD